MNHAYETTQGAQIHLVFTHFNQVRGKDSIQVFLSPGSLIWECLYPEFPQDDVHSLNFYFSRKETIFTKRIGSDAKLCLRQTVFYILRFVFFWSAINCWKMKESKNIYSPRLTLYCSFPQNQDKTHTQKKNQTKQKT